MLISFISIFFIFILVILLFLFSFILNPVLVNLVHQVSILLLHLLQLAEIKIIVRFLYFILINANNSNVFYGFSFS